MGGANVSKAGLKLNHSLQRIRLDARILILRPLETLGWVSCVLPALAGRIFTTSSAWEYTALILMSQSFGAYLVLSVNAGRLTCLPKSLSLG